MKLKFQKEKIFQFAMRVAGGQSGRLVCPSHELTNGQSGAEATAVQTLSRPPKRFAAREAFGLRSFQRRFSRTRAATLIQEFTARNFSTRLLPPCACVVLIFSLFQSAASAQSLWSDDTARPMFADKRAAKVGDILTVLVQETSTASKKNSTSTAKNNAMDASVSSFLYGAGAGGASALLSRGGSMPALKYSNKNTFDGGGTIDNSQHLVTSVAVRVIDVLPNGNLMIEGTRETSFSGEKQNAMLHGIVRIEDILSNNTIYSYNIADAKVQIISKGKLTDNERRGWFTWAWSKLTPF